MTTVNRLEKLALNNQIVRMRKDVKRARLWLINSLTNRVKKLKGTKKNELEKNQRKAEKLRNEIYLLKHICIDEVSKFAICNKQELPNLSLNDSELDLSQKLMLQLANHRLVQQQVQVFRQTYTGPMDRLILLVRSLGLQYQKKKSRKQAAGAHSGKTEVEVKMTSVSQETSSGRKKTNSVPELEETPTSVNMLDSSSVMDSRPPSNLRTQDEIKCDDSDFSPVLKVPYNVVDKVKIPPDLPHPQGNCTRDKKIENLGKSSETFSATNSNVDQQLDRKGNLAQKVQWPKLSVAPVNKKFGTMIIKQLHLDSESDAISLGEPSIDLDNRKIVNQRPTDSFFLGGVDLSSDDESTKKDPIPLCTKRVNKRTNSEIKAFKEKTFSSRSRYQLSNGKSEIELKITNPVPTVQDLHPSWQAKRKEKEQQINIDICQGKKIRFDDY